MIYNINLAHRKRDIISNLDSLPMLNQTSTPNSNKVRDRSTFGQIQIASPVGTPTYSQILNGVHLKTKESQLDRKNLMNTLRLDYSEFKKSQLSIKEIQQKI